MYEQFQTSHLTEVFARVNVLEFICSKTLNSCIL